MLVGQLVPGVWHVGPCCCADWSRLVGMFVQVGLFSVQLRTMVMAVLKKVMFGVISMGNAADEVKDGIATDGGNDVGGATLIPAMTMGARWRWLHRCC